MFGLDRNLAKSKIWTCQCCTLVSRCLDMLVGKLWSCSWTMLETYPRKMCSTVGMLTSEILRFSRLRRLSLPKTILRRDVIAFLECHRVSFLHWTTRKAFIEHLIPGHHLSACRADLFLLMMLGQVKLWPVQEANGEEREESGTPKVQSCELSATDWLWVQGQHLHKEQFSSFWFFTVAGCVHVVSINDLLGAKVMKHWSGTQTAGSKVSWPCWKETWVEQAEWFNLIQSLPAGSSFGPWSLMIVLN